MRDIMRYRYNPSCACGRCRAHGFMGPAVLITIGVLFLLDQLSNSHWLKFWDSTWPALLIVIGLVMFLQHNASVAGHVPRQYMVMPPPGAPVYPGQPPPPVAPSPVVTPPPAAAAGSAGSGANWNNPGDPGVHNG